MLLLKALKEKIKTSKRSTGIITEQTSYLCTIPDLIMSKLLEFLQPIDIIHLSQTCKQLNQNLPVYPVIYAKTFKGNGPYHGHFCPEKWFDGPLIKKYIRDIRISFIWKDQGFGNRKGQIWLKLVRNGSMVKETKPTLCGVADHFWDDVDIHVTSKNPVVKEFKPGDRYCFMRNVGGGGGHELHVRNFKAVVRLEDLREDN